MILWTIPRFVVLATARIMMQFNNIEDTGREASLVEEGKMTLVWDMEHDKLEVAVYIPSGDVQKSYKRVCSVEERPVLGTQVIRPISI